MKLTIHSACLLVASFGIAFNGMVWSRKPHVLKILSFLPFTGTPMIDGRTLQSTENMLAEIVNNRTDILPDYHIEFEYRDEADSGMGSATAAATYVRNMTESVREQNTYLAPVTAGIFYHPGCKSWGQIAHHMNMVAIASSCTAPSQTARRNLYPNQYRIRSSSQLSLTARIHFMTRMAKWKKIGMMMFMNTNPYNLEAATIVYDACVKAGYEIIAFEASSDFNDELMQTMKKADIRIFTFESAELAITITFLCQAYKAGIRGPKYMFIFQLLSFSDPNIQPPSAFSPSCTKQNYIEQIQQSIFVGTPFPIMVPVQGATLLNHTQADFERLFDGYTNKTRKTDYGFRHLAYDLALHSIVTLDGAEKMLAEKNMSLRDFREHPSEVMLATNKSASQVNFRDLRFGNFHYSKRLEWDYEPQLVATWILGKGMQVRYTVTLREDADVNDINSYFIQAILPFDKDLPKDAGYQKIAMEEVTEPVFGVVVCFSAITFLIDCLLFAKKTLRNGVGYRSLSCKIWASDAIFLLSFLVINAAAITFATKHEWQTNVVCVLNVLLTTAGVTLFQSCLVLKLLAAYQYFQKALTRVPSRASTSARRISQVSLETAGGGDPAQPTKLQEPHVPSSAIAYSFANIIAVVVWQIFDPLRAVTAHLTKMNQYDEASDTYLIFFSAICQSNSASNWVAGLVVINCLPLFFGVGLALRLRGAMRFMGRYPDVKRLIMAIVCSVTLYLGTVAIAFLSTTTVMLQLTLAFALIIYSTLNAVIIYLKVEKRPSRLAPIKASMALPQSRLNQKLTSNQHLPSVEKRDSAVSKPALVHAVVEPVAKICYVPPSGGNSSLEEISPSN